MLQLPRIWGSSSYYGCSSIMSITVGRGLRMRGFLHLTRSVYKSILVALYDDDVYFLV